ncbi:succinate dehydrogenase, cytochrome b556 subunit [Actibacterium sp. D379-3]
MPDANRGERPLSPFMLGQYYRAQLTSMTSIVHRLTGIAMLGSAFLIVWWFLAAATSAEYFDTVNWLITSWVGDVVMFASLWAVCYHLLGGLKHLYWDSGRGLEMKTAEMLGKGVIVGSVILSVIAAIII